MTTAAMMLAKCRSFLGVHEDPPGSNVQRFSRDLGRPAQPSCADFLIDCAGMVGLALPSRSPATALLAQAFQDAGRFGQEPKVGAFCFIYHPELHRIGHVCIVEAVNPDGSVTTINGNSNIAGGRTGGLVCRNIRRANIAGYGYPSYAPVIPRPRPASSPTLMPVIRVGSDGAAVAAAQRDLNRRGAIPQLRVDGSFGPATGRAVKDFQMRHKLDHDGVVGPHTWAALLGA